MAVSKSFVLFFGVALLLASISASSASGDSNSNNKKDADSILPLFFLLSGSGSAMTGATVWMVALFSVGVMALLGYQKSGLAKVKEQ